MSDTDRNQRRKVQVKVTRQAKGYVAQGPGFYVWDEDAHEVSRVAEGLIGGSLERSRTARFMMISLPAEPGAV